MEYWSTIITQKSWEILQKIRKEINFVLIGGWAVYLWAKSHKSKDIDIVISYEELNKLKLKHNVKKNDSLKKYEIVIDEIDIDIYVPFYSKLPLLGQIKNYTSNIESFKVANPEFLIILKLAAEINRSNSEKGLKDRIDIIDLLLKYEVDFKEFNKLIEKEKLQNFRKRLIEIISRFKEIKYLDLNPREFKLKREKLIKDLRNQ